MRFLNPFRSKVRESTPATTETHAENKSIAVGAAAIKSPSPAVHAGRATDLDERLLAAVENVVENGELCSTNQFVDDLAAVTGLVAEGADVNCTTRDGWTPLLIAVSSQPMLVELLLKLGANPNIASEHGYTPLMRAGGKGQEDNVRHLLAAGADPLLRDCNGESAFTLTSQAMEFDCAALISAPHISALLARRASIVKNADSELLPLPDSAQMMVGVTRGVVGGVVRWVSIEFDDGARLQRVRLIDELVMELPREFAARGIKTFSVPQDQQ